ncbi:MAG: hypothetical protein WD023_07795 [Ilumatobacteraceae bacterium]
MGRTTSIAIIGALVLAACSGGSDGATTATTAAMATTDTSTAASVAPTTAVPPAAMPADEATLAAIGEQLDASPDGCEPLDTRQCLLPFPSNAYRADDRVAFPAVGMPANASGIGIDPAEWNRNDGFSPNTPILTHVTGLDAAASNLPSWTDLEASLADDATVVVVDTESGERVPLWAELDAKAAADEDRLLEIHPAVPLREGATFAVALRDLVTDGGGAVEPTALFRTYRDALTTDIAAVEDRRADMEATFDALGAAGVDRADLQLAWSFTVATTDDIAGRMLAIRDDTLAALGDDAPAFTIISATPNTDDDIALQVEGTFTVPNYLTGDGGPGNRFFYGDGVTPVADEVPVRNGSVEAPFMCNISVATMNGTEPAHLVQYGHGLLGSNREINAGNVRAMSNEHNVVHCATKWAGMSEDDIGNAITALSDFSSFPTMADRLQQGVLNTIVMGRLMTADDGLVSDPNFQRADGSPLIDTSVLNYDGNSQGGIMGLMLSAVSPDINRSVLGVMGMNYSLLLSRSVDFETYESVMKPAYPNDLDRVLILGLVQMLWDRGEGAGYVQHVTSDPYEGTPAKTVLLHVAFGDHQVSELTAMIAARAMGATIHRPVTADGRSGEREPGWGIESTTYPSTGSGLVIWDSGSDPIPLENLPPSGDRDPHEDPRADPDVRTQKAAFLFDDTLIDVCAGAPCTADPRD